MIKIGIPPRRRLQRWAGGSINHLCADRQLERHSPVNIRAATLSSLRTTKGQKRFAGAVNGRKKNLDTKILLSYTAHVHRNGDHINAMLKHRPFQKGTVDRRIASASAGADRKEREVSGRRWCENYSGSSGYPTLGGSDFQTIIGGVYK